jgi:hypothetical protein
MGRSQGRALAFARVLVPASLAVYFAVGYARIRTTDWVPFSAWALFVYVPNRPATYTLKFQAADGKPLQPPVAFESGKFGDPGDITAYYLINHFGMAWEKGDAEKAQKFQALVEANVLPRDRKLEWELMRVTYDPIRRWKTGAVEETPLARFRSGKSHD